MKKIIFVIMSFAIAGLCNSYNIIDGINGLASMVGFLTLLAVLYVSLKEIFFVAYVLGHFLYVVKRVQNYIYEIQKIEIHYRSFIYSIVRFNVWACYIFLVTKAMTSKKISNAITEKPTMSEVLESIPSPLF